jgi:histone-lysine N-methyltransferase SETMAR
MKEAMKNKNCIFLIFLKLSEYCHEIITIQFWFYIDLSKFLLSPFDKQRRVETSQQFLELCEGQEEEIIQRIVTGDETWIHHYDPESKQESMQWKHKGSPSPKKFKVQHSAGKVMATVFWDSEGILLIDYLPRKTTMNGNYYAEVLGKLEKAIKEKRKGKFKNGILLLHDNAPVHKAGVVQDALKKLKFQELNHPPYSPDLAPCDYFLFRKLKKKVQRTKIFG